MNENEMWVTVQGCWDAANIGKELEEIEVTPISIPVEMPVPEKTPAPERELEPVGMDEGA